MWCAVMYVGCCACVVCVVRCGVWWSLACSVVRYGVGLYVVVDSAELCCVVQLD